MRNRLVIVPTVLLAGVTLAGCTSAASTAPSASPTAASTNVPMPGSDPRTWAPQTVQPGESTVQAGQYLILGGLSVNDATQGIGVVSNDEQIMVVTQSGPDDFAMAQALRPGKVVLEVHTNSDFDPISEQFVGTPLATYTFTVEGGGNSATDFAELGDPAMPGSDPATWSPVVIPGGDTVETLTTRQYAVLSPDVKDGVNVEFSTSDRDVVSGAGESADGEVLVQAMNAGEATVTLKDAETGKVVMTTSVTVVDLDASP